MEVVRCRIFLYNPLNMVKEKVKELEKGCRAVEKLL